MALLITGIVLVVLGILCCFINKVPGPVIAFIGMLLFKFSPAGTLLAWWIVILCGVIAIASIFIIRALVPVVKSKVPAFGKGGTWGTTIGSLLAVLFAFGVSSWVVTLVILIALPFVLAFLFELISQKKAAAALNSAVGAFAIFCSTTLIKLIICIVMLYAGMRLMANDVAEDIEENPEEVTEQLQQAAEDLSNDMSEDYGF